MSITHAKVLLFKPSGKYYTEEQWRIPTRAEVIAAGGTGGDSAIPYSMIFSPDFRRIGGGAVLVESQEPWGYPHLFPTLTPVSAPPPPTPSRAAEQIDLDSIPAPADVQEFRGLVDGVAELANQVNSLTRWLSRLVQTMADLDNQ